MIPKVFSIVTVFMVVFLLLSGRAVEKVTAQEASSPSETVTDADGNVYQTVTIGKQVWTVENLMTTKYRDGSSIPHVMDGKAWGKLTEPAYCWYDNDPSYKDKCGAMYNWYAVAHGEIAPKGWHVPTDQEFDTLASYLILHGYNWDGSKEDNKIAKSLAGTTSWDKSKKTGVIGNDLALNNRSRFTALSGGYRHTKGRFHRMGRNIDLWSVTAFDASEAYARCLYYDYDNLVRKHFDKRLGFSVRLLRD